MSKCNPSAVNEQSLQAQYQNCPRANFLRRMGAYFYDLVAVAALLMLACVFAILVVIIGTKFGLLNISSSTDIADYLANSGIFAAYLAIVIITFYAYFWCNGGQTIGMKAWRLRVQKSDGSNISFTQALIRMATSAFGIGNIAVLFENRRAFQDLWAECDVVVLSKTLNRYKRFKG